MSRGISIRLLLFLVVMLAGVQPLCTFTGVPGLGRIGRAASFGAPENITSAGLRWRAGEIMRMPWTNSGRR